MSGILIKDFVNRLGLTGNELVKVQRLAETYLNAVQFKLSGRNRHGINTRPIICIQLACRSLGVPIRTKSAVALAGTTAAKYGLALKELAKLLNVETKVSLRELAVQFGCPQLQPKAEAVFREFVAKFQACPTKPVQLDPHSTLALVACFSCAAKNSRIKIDTKRLVSEYVNYPKEFQFLQEFIEATCQENLTSQPKRGLEPSASKKLKGSGTAAPASNGSNPAPAIKKIRLVSPYAGYSMLPFQHFEQTREYLDYLNWKAAVYKRIRGQANPQPMHTKDVRHTL
ncbi:Origin of replication complex subunit 6 [Massospora cicadina]|nr:Origin of replication complex subunit 6 [Massospora cicadina]